MQQLQLAVRKQVLIVPLWNWNNSWHTKGNAADSSNRTFMELKSIKIYSTENSEVVLIVPLWNWNMNKYVREVMANKGSNRTFMELKSLIPYWMASKSPVLIVPLWNWNDEMRQVDEWYFRF